MTYLEKQVEHYNKAVGDMGKNDGYNCLACKNKGLVFDIRNDEIISKRCGCIKIRKSLYLLKESGIQEQVDKKTLDSFIVDCEWQMEMCKKAKGYINDNSDSWFFIGGQSGSGKTHICTAICVELIKRGNALMYMRWADSTRELKETINTYQYCELIDKYKSIDILYIDDFFKVKEGDKPSSSDVRIAFEILNSRLIKNKKTIISSEFTLKQLLDFDEATASRINEKAKPYVLSISKSNEKNYRFK